MAALTRSELDLAVAEALAGNPALKEQLLADPRTVLAAIAGIPIPESVNITVHEESLTDIHLVLRPEAEEISDDDLQLVSGGWNPGPSSMCGGNCGPCS